MYNLVLNNLIKYLNEENHKGFDPYDTLNSPLISKKLGKWPSVLAIQFQKRNPLNIRSVIGIKKEHNPKGMGLFLQAYSRLYIKTGKKEFLDQAYFFYNWLKNNYSKGYSGYAWGYNFPWAGPEKYLNSYTPSSVVTSFVCNGIFEYNQIAGDEESKSILESACKFLDNDIQKSEFQSGICFSYTPLKADNCYNASLLTAEVFAKTGSILKNSRYKELAVSAMNYVLDKQHSDGRWNYSIDENTGSERQQIDFHQGFILVSLVEILKYTGISDNNIDEKIKKGLQFYRENQFFNDGSSLWRYPVRFPVDIHNQAQGIITFSVLGKYLNNDIEFAKVIADYTISNMLDSSGYFYFRKYRLLRNKIPYMRWSQAWMLLALTYMISKE